MFSPDMFALVPKSDVHLRVFSSSTVYTAVSDISLEFLLKCVIPLNSLIHVLSPEIIDFFFVNISNFHFATVNFFITLSSRFREVTCCCYSKSVM